MNEMAEIESLVERLAYLVTELDDVLSNKDGKNKE